MNKIIIALVLAILVLSLVNTALIIYFITHFRKEEVVKIIVVKSGEVYSLPNVTKADCVAVLIWRGSAGKYMPVLPPKFVSESGAILELVWIENKPPKLLKFGEFSTLAGFKILKGKVSVGDIIRPSSNIITFPEACFPIGRVIYVSSGK